jgi:hypothetical protein
MLILPKPGKVFVNMLFPIVQFMAPIRLVLSFCGHGWLGRLVAITADENSAKQRRCTQR